MMKNPTPLCFVLLLIILPIFSFRIPFPNYQKTAPSSIKLQHSAPKNFQKKFSEDTFEEIVREIIIYSYMRYGKDKEANAKYITQKVNQAQPTLKWMTVILDKGTSKAVQPFYAYATSSIYHYFLDEANPSENWIYLISGYINRGYSSNSKWSQKSERGSGVTDLMEKSIRKIIAASSGDKYKEMTNERAGQISLNINYMLTYQSGWNTLIYRCSAVGIGDFTPLINDLWFAPRSPVIPGTDQCYFIYESMLRIND